LASQSKGAAVARPAPGVEAMTWNAMHDPTANIVVVTYTGETTGEDMRAASAAAILLGRENDTIKFLVDATRLEITATIFDVYKMPYQQYVDEGVDRRSRIAVLEPVAPEALDAARFYQTACLNHGWFAKLFAERDRAIQWLISDR